MYHLGQRAEKFNKLNAVFKNAFKIDRFPGLFFHKRFTKPVKYIILYYEVYMYLKTTNRIQSLWDKAQAQHKDNFNLIMKNGKKYIVKNFSPNNGFTVFDNNFKVLAYDISNIDDLANCILSISKSKEN